MFPRNNLMGHVVCIAACLLLLPSFVGCNKNPLGRLAVSGRITLDGKPLDKGTIEFRPQAGGASVGSGGVITNGAFAIPTLQGLPPGKYDVRIFSGRPDDSPLPEGVPPGVNRPWIERIPARYNVQTTLVAEVSASGSNTFNFDLKTAP